MSTSSSDRLGCEWLEVVHAGTANACWCQRFGGLHKLCTHAVPVQLEPSAVDLTEIFISLGVCATSTGFYSDSGECGPALNSADLTQHSTN